MSFSLDSPEMKKLRAGKVAEKCCEKMRDNSEKCCEKEREAKNSGKCQRFESMEKPEKLDERRHDDVEEIIVIPDFVLAHRLSIQQLPEHHFYHHHHANVEIGRDNRERTMSMLSYLSGGEEDPVISKSYKYVTAAVLCFCYFSLVSTLKYNVMPFIFLMRKIPLNQL